MEVRIDKLTLGSRFRMNTGYWRGDGDQAQWIDTAPLVGTLVGKTPSCALVVIDGTEKVRRFINHKTGKAVEFTKPAPTTPWALETPVECLTSSGGTSVGDDPFVDKLPCRESEMEEGNA